MGDIKLTTDNYIAPLTGKKITIECDVDWIEATAKNLFGWRSATKQYQSIMDRIYNLNSEDFDRLVIDLYNKGWEA